jgi:hypothetical protein
VHEGELVFSFQLDKDCKNMVAVVFDILTREVRQLGILEIILVLFG